MILSLSTLIFLGCEQKETTNENTMKFIDPANFDPEVRLEDDFFNATNGAWFKSNPIPSDKSGWGTFQILNEQNRGNLKNIIDEVAADANAEPGSNRQKVRDLYLSGMDTIRLEDMGATPIQGRLDEIDQLASIEDVVEFQAILHAQTTPGMYYMRVDQDEKQPDTYILNAYQGGLGLPDRDFYFREDPRTTEIQNQYRVHISTLFQLVGAEAEAADQIAENIYALEKGMATNSRNRTELRNPEANYNKMTVEEFQSTTPNMNWSVIMERQEIPAQTELIVGQPEFFAGLNELLSTAPVEDWKNYLKWQILRESAPYLSSDFEKESFRFNSTVMNGVEVMEPRWKRMISNLNSSLPDAVSQLFVEQYFPPEAKVKANEMIDDITAAFEERIKNLQWMGDTTKQKALEKLSMFGRKIGYPDVWKDYSSIEISPDSYFKNTQNSWIYSYKENIAKLGKPIDKTEWGMPAAMVNAYYHPLKNEVVFPAGILQFPFFDFRADAAINYGGIGAVIGHELTHGFDDQGSQFGGDGSLASWWTETDRSAFEDKTKVLVEQYDSYTVLDTVPVSGQMTLGENIADFGGLTIAYAALQKNYERNGRPDDIDGMTAEQRFFMSWSQVWRIQYNDEAMAQRAKTDYHSPAIHRVNGVLRNMPEFYEAFDINPGDGMYRDPSERPVIW